MRKVVGSYVSKEEHVLRVWNEFLFMLGRWKEENKKKKKKEMCFGF